MPVPDADAWAVFGQLASVLIFLGALGGAVWKLRHVRRGGAESDPAPGTSRAATASEAAHAVAETQRTQGMVAGLETRIGELEGESGAVREALRRVGDVEKEIKEFRLMVAENYISREDWVPMTSRVISMLEEHTAMLARLDERSRRQLGETT